MPKANATRDIIIILVLAAVFAAGLFAYISPSIQRPTGPVLVASPAASTSADTRAADARRVAAAFVQHLAAARYDDAYLMMASAYRQMTSLASFRAACSASPFLSTATSVSVARTREERAPGQQGAGSLSASGVLVTRSGTVEAAFFFVEDRAGVAIVNVTIAGTAAFPMGTGAVSAAPDAGVAAKKN